MSVLFLLTSYRVRKSERGKSEKVRKRERERRFDHEIWKSYHVWSVPYNHDNYTECMWCVGLLCCGARYEKVDEFRCKLNTVCQCCGYNIPVTECSEVPIFHFNFSEVPHPKYPLWILCVPLSNPLVQDFAVLVPVLWTLTHDMLKACPKLKETISRDHHLKHNDKVIPLSH